MTAAALIAATAGTALAQVRAGGETHVNTYTTGRQIFPSVAVNAAGDFVVVWASYPGQDGDAYGVFGQRFDRTGARKGAEFQVNTFTTGYQSYVGHIGLAEDRQGGFVVAWCSTQQDGSGFGVFARRYDPSGTPVGVEFQVNTYTAGDEGGRTYNTAVALAMNPTRGDFIVTWAAYEVDATIRGQRYDALGVRQGGEFIINDVTGVVAAPGVAMNAQGEFVVAWSRFSGATGNYDWDVAARRFDATGAPRGGQFQVNTYTTGLQGYTGGLLSPNVALADSGAFTVVWNGDGRDDGNLDVFGQAFSAAGTPVGAEYVANTFTTDSQAFPTAQGDAMGNVVVAWQSNLQDGSSRGVVAQRFDAQGRRRGAEFLVNTYTTGFQGVPFVGLDPVGNFDIAWNRTNGDGTAVEVAVQRYGGLLATALSVDSGGNHVLEPGESVDVRPTWRNTNGAAQTFTATLSDAAGPAGGVPAITDGTGNYGTVADGADASCSDCYAVSVPDPPTRPATHWDGSALESITPDAQGQQKTWLLHVGHSFTDVPDTNPFYGFVETLLHNGVTAGCTPSTYCPGAATTREQMAIFVLVAKQGAGYAPPGCATPVFGDVPASSPFCRFIEELARRGVVSGCGGGNYCPSQPVTREQMAVFTLRTLDGALNPPACVAGSELFADVPASSGFCKWIEELARRGVVTGCGGGNYCPAQSMTREQMGVFIGVTFGLTLYG